MSNTPDHKRNVAEDLTFIITTIFYFVFPVQCIYNNFQAVVCAGGPWKLDLLARFSMSMAGNCFVHLWSLLPN